MSDAEQVANAEAKSCEKRKDLMNKINQRRRAQVLSGLSEDERKGIASVFATVATNGTHITPDDVVTSTTAFSVAEPIKAAREFIERESTDGKGLSLEDFLVWWGTPATATSTRKLPQWKYALQSNYYSRVEDEKRSRQRCENPIGANPTFATYIKIGGVSAGAAPQASITVNVAPTTRPIFAHEIREKFGAAADEGEEGLSARGYVRAVVELQSDADPDNVETVLTMFTSVLDEISKEAGKIAPRVTHDTSTNSFVFEAIFRDESDPIIEILGELLSDPYRAEFVGGDVLHGAIAQIAFHHPVGDILSLEAKRPLRDLLGAVEVRAHLIFAQDVVRKMTIRTLSHSFLKKVARSRLARVTEYTILFMLARLVNGVSYQASFASFSEVIDKILAEIETIALDALVKDSHNDDEVAKLLAECAQIREKATHIMQRRTRYDAYLPDLLVLLDKRVSMSKFFSGRDASEARFLFIGPSMSGKTTFLYRAVLGETVTTIPTVGFNVETIKFHHGDVREDIVAWDLGGHEKLQPLWHHYVSSEPGEKIIFFVPGFTTACSPEEEIVSAFQTCKSILGDTPCYIFVPHSGTPSRSADDVVQLLQLDEDAASRIVFVDSFSPDSVKASLARVLGGGGKVAEESDEPQRAESDILEGQNEVFLELAFGLRGIAKRLSRVDVNTPYGKAEIVLDNVDLVDMVPRSREAFNEAFRAARHRNRVSKAKKGASSNLTFECTSKVVQRQESMQECME